VGSEGRGRDVSCDGRKVMATIECCDNMQDSTLDDAHFTVACR